MTERPCTCPPDERPARCEAQYALSQCLALFRQWARHLNEQYAAERAAYREVHPHVDTKRLALPK